MNTASDIKGRVFDIQRFCLHDGPGIRTTVFLKGCPLRCKWCHNPESLKKESEIFFHGGVCIGCGECVAACKAHAHFEKEGKHIFDRTKCTGCFACVDACPTGALEATGKETAVEEIVSAVLRDAPFYKDGGGVTVSGGEPFMQSEFLQALLKALKAAGLHVCVETSGCADTEAMLTAKEYVDIFLFDCKMQPGEKHREFIGSDGFLMHENLKALDNSGANIILRCPIIPGVNDNAAHFEYISSLASTLSNLIEVNILPYHTTGLSKRTDIGMELSFTVEDFDAKAFKERIKNNLLPILSQDLKVKLL